MRVLSIPGRGHENRYFGLLLGALEAEGVTIVPSTIGNTAALRYDVLHLNFPTHYITENNAVRAWILSAGLGLYLIGARLLGRRIVYTVHDVVPFRSRHPWLLGRFLRLVHDVAHGFVFLSMSSRDEFVARYRRDEAKPWILAAHGPYPTTLLTQDERAVRRRQLAGEDAPVLIGFLGSIKPYKNLAALLEVPARLPDGRHTILVVAGQVERGYEQEAQAVLDRIEPGRLIRLDTRLADTALDKLIQTVDLVLLPYRKGSNSGVALLVLGNHGRLIGSDLPVFQELASLAGPPWVYSVPTSGSLSETIALAMHDRPSDGDQTRLATYLEQVGFKQGAIKVAAFYNKIVNG